MKPTEPLFTRRRLLALGAGTVAAVAVTGRLRASRMSQSSSPPAGTRTLPDPAGTYDPFRAGEKLPDGYFQVLGRDFIPPVYEPRFVGADDIGWPEDADVIGVEIDGEARAYPVGFLGGRELVNDEIADTPVLISW